jgi:hypothetical protein
MIVINKPFDGVHVKFSKRDLIIRLCVKPFLAVFFFAFWLVFRHL